MSRAASADGASAQPRGVFEVDEERALAELDLAWAAGGYHGFSADGGTWARSATPGMCSRAAPGRAEPGDQGALAGDAVMPGSRAALSLVPDEPDQVLRRERFDRGGAPEPPPPLGACCRDRPHWS